MENWTFLESEMTRSACDPVVSQTAQLQWSIKGTLELAFGARLCLGCVMLAVFPSPCTSVSSVVD